MVTSRAAIAAIAVAGMLAACSSTASPATQKTSGAPPEPNAIATSPAVTSAQSTPAATHGTESTVAEVPWSQVGPGWTLAVWNPVTPHRPGEQGAPETSPPEDVSATLYLVDPVGNRYTITTFEPGLDLILADWSADGSHAVFTPSGSTPTSAILVDLHSGNQTTMAITGYPRFTRPSGSELLVSTSFNGNVPGTLKRFDLQANLQYTYPTTDLDGAGRFSGDYVESFDGTQLMLGTANFKTGTPSRTDNSLVVMANDGSVVRTLAAPMPDAVCAPVKWWTPTAVLLRCSAEHGSANQLWTLPVDGSAPTALTAVNSGQEDDPGFGGDLGDSNAWELPSGTFLQSMGACGTAFLSKLTADGHTTRVKIPGVSANVFVTGATADRLLVRGQVGCSGTTSLVSYDPTANTSSVLLGPPVNGGGVSQAMLYPGAES